MPAITSGDTAIHYQDFGKGPALVLLHPFPASHRIWLPVAERLATRYRVILPDLRAHGDSSPGDGPATMEKHAADIARVCQDAGITRAVFAGVSIGGYILFECWRRFRERFAGLILCDTRATPDTEEGRATRLQSADDVLRHGPESFLDGMTPKLLGETTRRNRPDIADEARAMMRRMTVAGIAAAQRGMAARPDSTATLATINVPTLLLVGEEDTLTPVSDAQAMHRAIPGSELRVISKAGHYAVFEQPDESARVIRAFLDNLNWS